MLDFYFFWCYQLCCRYLYYLLLLWKQNIILSQHTSKLPSLFRPLYLRHSFVFWVFFSASKNVLLLDHIMCLKRNVRSDMNNNTSDTFGQQMWATSHGTEEQIEHHVCSLCVPQQHIISLHLPRWKVLTSGRRQPVWPPLNKTLPHLESDVCQLSGQHGGLCACLCRSEWQKLWKTFSKADMEELWCPIMTG